MTLVTFILLLILLCSTGTYGKRIRAPCPNTMDFHCDNGQCIFKGQWCDGSHHCSDQSDEEYCQKGHWPYMTSCNDEIHFACEDGRTCIPQEGHCDGYSSCPDNSDEKNCPCEEIQEDEGSIEYEATVSNFETHQKCWKIVVGEKQYVDLSISTIFVDRVCSFGNVTVFPATEDGDDGKVYNFNNLICPSLRGLFPKHTSKNSFKLQEDTLIRYRSTNVDYRGKDLDLITITYNKVDVLCEEQLDAFKCTPNSCISPEKQCDGIEDCRNGRDEQNCVFGAFSAASVKSNQKKAVKWMRDQHNADWGWKENTPKAIVALHLAGDMNLNGSNIQNDLIAKQLELEVSTFLLRNYIEKQSISELSAYINALLVICHDPRNFYGFNLVTTLQDELETLGENSPPFPYLTLCNAKVPTAVDAVDRLLEILENSPHQGFVFEIQALAIMALTCAINNDQQYAYLQQNVTEALKNLKKEQMEDGSFGNEYTTALVLQALIANNQENAQDWNPKSAITFLTQKQEADGSFDDFLTTYLILPVLNVKSLLDVGKINCTKELKRPKDGDLASDIKSRLGGKTVVKYSLFIGDEKDQIHPIVLRTHENITVFELMTLAADVDPKYKFKTHQIKKKMYVYEISNIPNNPESNTFWIMYEGVENGTIPISEQSPDKMGVHKKNHIIMWYKTLNIN